MISLRKNSPYMRQKRWGKVMRGLWAKNGPRLIPLTYSGHSLPRCCNSVIVITVSLCFKKFFLLLRAFAFNNDLSVHIACMEDRTSMACACPSCCPIDTWPTSLRIACFSHWEETSEVYEDRCRDTCISVYIFIYIYICFLFFDNTL